MTSIQASVDGSSPKGIGWVEVAAAALVALVFAAGYVVLDRQPLLWDEYYHLLAGRSWAADGTVTVGDGRYGRQAWFSALVGWVFRTFGEGLTQARMVSAVFQVAWVTVVFAWVRREAGRTAAWTAALLLATSPIVLVNSVMVRFYSVNSLLVTLSALALYGGMKPRVPAGRRVGALAGAIALGWVSYRITGLTRIWVSGLLLWSAGVAVLAAYRSGKRNTVFALMGLGGAAVIAFLWISGWFSETWAVYQSAPVWADRRATDVRWYADLLLDDYPTMFTLLPLAGLLAIRRKPALGTLAVTAFLTALLLLSGAGPKSERYLLPVLSFFFILWGMAIAELVPAMLGWGRRFVEELVGETKLDWPGRVVPPTLVAGVILFVLATNVGFTRARMWPRGLLASVDRPSQARGVSFREWEAVAEDLGALMEEVDVVVTSNTLHLLYHVGDYDYGMHPTIIPEVQPPEEFGIDPRDGRPTISHLESLKTIVARNETGLVVGERWRWGSPSAGFTPDVAEYVYDTMLPVPTPSSTPLVVYRWGSAGHESPDGALGGGQGDGEPPG
jgi:hypothetical protein